MKIINLDDFKHGLRVAALGFRLSQALNLSHYIMDNVYLSGILHDVGKAYLDQDILNKQYRLTASDKKHIENHSYYSYREILQLNYNVDVALNVLYHHENYNGTGYPVGLKGDNIPIGARVLRICDMFDALISDRPYRKALSIEKTIEIMNKEKGNFDIEIFNIFIDCVLSKDYKYIREGGVHYGIEKNI